MNKSELANPNELRFKKNRLPSQFIAKMGIATKGGSVFGLV